MRYLLFILFFSLSSFAQHEEQPQKESTEDLRSATILFMITDVSSEKTYQLERTPGLDHFLRRIDGEDDGVIRKTDTRDARKLDQDFAARFLRIQYELPSVPGDCRVVWKLNMKGETQDVCKKDDKKTQEIQTFVDGLKKRF